MLNLTAIGSQSVWTPTGVWSQGKHKPEALATVPGGHCTWLDGPAVGVMVLLGPDVTSGLTAVGVKHCAAQISATKPLAGFLGSYSKAPISQARPLGRTAFR